MTTDEMENEVKDFCRNLILKSSIEEWLDGYFIKNNIRIDIKSYKEFKVTIYTDNNLTTENKELIYDCGFWGNQKKRTIRKMLGQKWKDIYNAIKDKERYESVLETYNLLPIKEIRRKKLQSINEDK